MASDEAGPHPRCQSEESFCQANVRTRQGSGPSERGAEEAGRQGKRFGEEVRTQEGASRPDTFPFQRIDPEEERPIPAERAEVGASHLKIPALKATILS